ncbi:hypothetical protein BGZ58_008749, partial [Dissophora ornata]
MADGNLNLFCLVNGDLISRAFPLTILSTNSAGHLRDLIKAKRPNVDADELTLWRVSILISNQNEEIPILLDSLKETEKKKLGPATRLSKVFPEEQPEETIHIIVQRPAAAAPARAASPLSLSPSISREPGFENTVLHKLDGLHDQGDTTQRIAQEVWELAKQMNDRLVLIQSKTEAILTQNYELLEYTIPRLFIVLPETSTPWDPTTMLRTKFRLHFICECGEHTKASGSKIPHHLHLANHEGYVVNKPTEFFEKYGPFLMLMLEMLKLGAGIAGHVVPALANLKVVNALDFAESSVDSVTSNIIKG